MTRPLSPAQQIEAHLTELAARSVLAVNGAINAVDCPHCGAPEGVPCDCTGADVDDCTGCLGCLLGEGPCR